MNEEEFCPYCTNRDLKSKLILAHNIEPKFYYCKVCSLVRPICADCESIKVKFVCQRCWKILCEACTFVAQSDLLLCGTCLIELSGDCLGSGLPVKEHSVVR
ncbi:MAG: hypothetical protein ACFFBD_21870 [Candidatus Hodarchaeota archaeon]